MSCNPPDFGFNLCVRNVRSRMVILSTSKRGDMNPMFAVLVYLLQVEDHPMVVLRTEFHKMRRIDGLLDSVQPGLSRHPVLYSISRILRLRIKLKHITAVYDNSFHAHENREIDFLEEKYARMNSMKNLSRFLMTGVWRE